MQKNKNNKNAKHNKPKTNKQTPQQTPQQTNNKPTEHPTKHPNKQTNKQTKTKLKNIKKRRCLKELMTLNADGYRLESQYFMWLSSVLVPKQ